MNDLRDGWENIDEWIGIPGFGITSKERFVKGRSGSIYHKIRRMFIRDFIIKGVSVLFMLANLYLYRDHDVVFNLNAIFLGLIILSVMVILRYYRHFRAISDPSMPSRENLSSLLSFLRSGFQVPKILFAATYMFGFIPGLLLYFMLAYGYLEPISNEGYFVFSFLCLTGMIFGFILDTRQVSFHIKHIAICLSDLNDNALAMASQHIESKRKQDVTIMVLLQIVLLVGFLVVIAILKSVVT